jgi:hypothetical protein
MIYTAKNTIQISVLCPERGTTGMREAIVNMVRIKKAQDEGKSPEDAALKMHDPYDSKYDQGALYFDSDDRQWDKSMPGHPLTRARRKMQAIVDALAIPDEIKRDALFAK